MKKRVLSDDESQGSIESEEVQKVPTTNDKKRSRGNEIGEERPGKILSITLNNFMCHEHYQVKLGPNVNFITGSNGSGKSAILTALIICLGSRVGFTQRATNLRTLIKEGQNTALITVVISNNGSGAYKSEIYGDRIIVERRISREGVGSVYKIKNSQDKLVSNKKEELSAICDHLKIQADNPIIILSQENAKKFIGNTTSNDKYKMFLKGTNLSQLAEDLLMITDATRTTEKIIKEKVEELPSIKEDFLQAEAKYRSLEKAHELHYGIKELKKEMAWSQVVEFEKKEKALIAKEEEEKKRVDLVHNKINQRKIELEDVQDCLKQIEEEAKKHGEKEAELTEKKNAVRQRSEQSKASFDDAEKTIEEIVSTIKKNKLEIGDLKNKIQTENDKLNHGDSKKKEIAQKIESIDSKLKEFEQKIIDNEDKINHNGIEHEAKLKEIAQIEQKIKEIDPKLYQYKENLHKYNSIKANSLSVFGSNIPGVLDDISKERRFTVKPIGPIGRYVKIKHPKWTKVVESVVGSFLDAFMVTNHSDHKLLENILSARRCQNRIFVSSLDQFDYSVGEPDKSYLTILRALEFSDEIVKRQLIVSNKIEKIILIEDRKTADEVMYRPPHNVASCFTVDGFQVGTKGGGYQTIAINLYNGPSRLSQGNEAASQKLRDAVNQLQQELNEQTKILKNCQNEERGLDKTIREYKNNNITIKGNIRQLKVRKEDLEQELAAEETANIAVLEESLQESNNRRDIFKNQFKAAVESHRIAKLEKDNCAEEFEKVRTEILAFKKGKHSIEERKNKEIENIEKIRFRIEHYNAKLNELNTNLDRIQVDRNNNQEELEKRMKTALIYCPQRVKVTQTPEVLDKEIQKLEQQLERAQNVVGKNLQECLTEYEDKKLRYKKAKSETNSMQNFIEELHNALQLRRDKWEFFRQSISKRIRSLFVYQLSHRGFSGKLEIDHTNEKLIPHVQVNKGDRGALTSSNDPKSLSGGEKSYSTICLLLSFWEAIECPIRCLDEFDVFMDDANRKISAELLINSARMSKGVQHILITPQSINDIVYMAGPDTKFIRLNEPDRDPKQTTLKPVRY
ncbi:P-loop containing nucleoside triphosphate hydrolase protein [Neoconidiobolus thromboides FSU 785]|nr:P-loop containing nucleoside triphosphate hydrolase protein [Neoconidiobolus thromboides FSU 785]